MSDNGGIRVLTDLSEVLYRHVYPEWLEDDGLPSSQAFWPWRTRDAGKLSTDRSARTTPDASFALATAEPPAGFGLTSSGIWGLSVGEVCEHQLIPSEDPVVATAEKPANPAHALVDFTAHSENRRRKIGQKLKVRAIARKKLYPSDRDLPNGPTEHLPEATAENGH